MNTPSHAELDPDRLLRYDHRRLVRQWQRLQRVAPQRVSHDLERWQESLLSARHRFDARQQVRFDLDMDPELPISRYRDSIIDLIQNRQVVVVCGETGSGKSTQLPKLCLAAGLGRHGWIGHTQPRRLAARSIAKRLAEETGTNLGEGVGYKIRFQDVLRDSATIKLMTDGVLLSEIHRDSQLEAYDCIIIDEAHERSINIDLLLAYLVAVLKRRPELRLVITSATIDAERFSEHFCDAIGPAPIVMVEGRSYPVEIRYRGALARKEQRIDAHESELNDAPEWTSSQMSRFCDAVDELFQEGTGDILAFFPTERDIRDAHKRLKGHLTRQGNANRIEVLPLYARLTEAEQQRVFQTHAKTRIVLATNVAESSLTVPGIRYVIDTGTARISRFAAKSRVQ
ncbi:MAG: DEAD/DEAH box helicase, partial [Pirellula sp.]|nr:DEAD/DEAH box helicase [Pirellula sp.]